MLFDIVKLTLIFTFLDAIYLYLMKNNFFTMIRNIQHSNLEFALIPALFCYIFLIFILYYFIVLKKRPLYEAFFLGFAIYGVYETTNLAIFKKWSPLISLIDTIWGGILFYSSYVLFKLIT